MFKHTGIIRRIDDIGRIIIPKEVRRKFRICDGDPIEIGEDGDAIALRKYSVIEFWSEFTQKILDSFSKTTSLPVILCSRNSILASYGTSLKARDILSNELTEALLDEEKCCYGCVIVDDTEVKAAETERIYLNGNLEGAIIIPAHKEGLTDFERGCLTQCVATINEFLM